MNAATRNMHRVVHRGRLVEVPDGHEICHFCETAFSVALEECTGPNGGAAHRRIPPRVMGFEFEFYEWCGQCIEGASLKYHAAVERGIARARLPDAFSTCDIRKVVLERVHGDDAAVRRVEEWLDKGRGNLTLTGETGAGKTSLVYYAVARAISDSEGAAKFLFVSAFDLGVARRNSRLGEEAELVEEALEAESLIVDDLGSEPAAHAEVLSYVISSRHEDDLETIVTTWMNADELGARYGHGVARRIRDRVTLVKLRGRR